MLDTQCLQEGESVEIHVNEDADEVLVVLEGEVAFQCGDRSVVALAGSMVFAPRGVPRAWRTVGRAARTLKCVYRAGLEMPLAAA